MPDLRRRPTPDLRRLLGDPVCRDRGYCGPFTRHEYYAMLEAWSGFGRCEECGCIVPVPMPGEAAGWVGWLVPPAEAA